MSGAALVSPRMGWYIVAILATSYFISYVDRQILALLIDPIKASLAISDTQFSLLTGFAFSIFFAVAGLPLGWAADVYRRNLVIGFGILVWSLATTASGFADSYGALFAARILVGIGEAALTPAAYSLMADVIAPARLGRAIGIFSMGSQFGAAAAYLFGGLALGHLAGADWSSVPMLGGMEAWQRLFVIVGIPGLLIAVLLLATVRDPGRIRSATRGPSMAEALAELRGHRGFLVAHFSGFTGCAAAFFGLAAWLPALVGRRFDLDPAEVGRMAGLLVLLMCPLGSLTAGWVSDWLTRRGSSDPAIRTAILGSAIMACAMVGIGLFPVGPLLVAAIALALFVAPWPLVLAPVSIQNELPPHLRARTTALFLLIANLIGQTGAITLIALLTDYAWRNSEMLHWSLAVVCGGAVLLSIIPLRKLARRGDTSSAVFGPALAQGSNDD